MFVPPASHHVILALLDTLNRCVQAAELALLDLTVLFVILAMLLQLVINVLPAILFLQAVHQLYAADALQLCQTACNALLALHAIYAKSAIHQEHVMAVFPDISQQTAHH